MSVPSTESACGLAGSYRFIDVRVGFPATTEITASTINEHCEVLVVSWRVPSVLGLPELE